jgi:hypothetical protein
MQDGVFSSLRRRGAFSACPKFTMHFRSSNAEESNLLFFKKALLCAMRGVVEEL